MLDDLIERLESNPQFHSFLLDGQTVLLEDYLRVRPDAAQRVRALARSGRLQAGPWYILADELTPSGEALVRNLLAGLRDSRRIGDRLGALYSPDAFGHPAAWPALAREFGLAHGVLWRGLAPGPGDGDLFRWRAPQGAEVLLYHLPRDGYEIGAALPADEALLPGAWARIRDTLVGRARSPHVAVFVGADHHAVHPEPVRLRDLLAALEPGHDVRISRLDQFLAAAARDAHSLPVIGGELRWSYGYTWTLQGTHGTRLPLKRANARAELLLERYAEPLSALARLTGGRDRAPLVSSAWRTLLRAQFHDTICGTTHDAAAIAAAGRIADAAMVAREAGRSALVELVGYDADHARRSAARAEPALVVWNAAARTRSGVATADLTFFRHDVLVGPPSGREVRIGPGRVPFSLVDERGDAVALQVIETREAIERMDAPRHYPDADAVDVVRVAFELPRVAGMGSAVLRLDSARPPARASSAAWGRGRRLGNDLIEVTIERDGRLSLDERHSGSRFAGLLGAEWEPDLGDAYTFEPAGQQPPRQFHGRASATLRATGPLIAIAEVRFEAPGAAFRMFVSVRAGEPFVRIALDVDNHATERRLRLRLPLGLSGAPAVAGAAFVSERRAAIEPVLTGFPAEHPVATAPAHRFAGSARGDRGLVLLSPGHFEHEWTAGGDLLFTVLRSVGQLSRDDLQARPGHAAWPTPIPGAQCLGRHRLELALAPISESELEGSSVHRLWEDAFLPPQALWLRNADTLRPAPVTVELSGEGLVLSALKPAEQGSGMVLRCYNATGVPQMGRWRIQPVPREVNRVRADESMPRPVTMLRDGTVEFTAEPHEIVTFMC